jgi:C4-dicarboxylate-specific signal transduction histidine kinase
MNSVSLTLDLAGEPVPAAVDKVQFEQVLLNLMRNALEAIVEAKRPGGRLRVRAWTDRGAARIEVSDNGGGVRQALAADLFKPFTTSKSGGMGLGLNISRSLVESSGGSLDLVASGPDGTTFAIRLPPVAKPPR